MTSQMAASLPPSVILASKSSSWSLLGFAPAPATSWALSLSDAIPSSLNSSTAVVAFAPPPPQLGIQLHVDQLLFTSSPLMSLVVSQTPAPPDLTSLGISFEPWSNWTTLSPSQDLDIIMLLNGSTSFSYTVPDNVNGAVTESWNNAGSSMVMTGVFVGAAILIHLVLYLATNLSMRLNGATIHTATPNLILWSLAATLPSVLFWCSNVVSWEVFVTKSAPLAAIASLAACVGLYLSLIAFISWLATVKGEQTHLLMLGLIAEVSSIRIL